LDVAKKTAELYVEMREGVNGASVDIIPSRAYA
jgi:hypothetical protein